MDYGHKLVSEFRDRIIERYDGMDLVEILELSATDVCDAFFDRCLDNQELIQETGIYDIEDDN